MSAPHNANASYPYPPEACVTLLLTTDASHSLCVCVCVTNSVYVCLTMFVCFLPALVTDSVVEPAADELPKTKQCNYQCHYGRRRIRTMTNILLKCLVSSPLFASQICIRIQDLIHQPFCFPPLTPVNNSFPISCFDTN